jgi:hypothetical protein
MLGQMRFLLVSERYDTVQNVDAALANAIEQFSVARTYDLLTSSRSSQIEQPHLIISLLHIFLTHSAFYAVGNLDDSGLLIYIGKRYFTNENTSSQSQFIRCGRFQIDK